MPKIMDGEAADEGKRAIETAEEASARLRFSKDSVIFKTNGRSDPWEER